jgi:hypothetical protein
VPPIVEIVNDAYFLAQRWRYRAFVLTEISDGQTPEE